MISSISQSKYSHFLFNQRRSAFSLPELLIVIGIIGVLIAMSFPVLGKTKQSAWEVVSLSNIRQIGMALQQYASSNKESVPVLYRPELGFDDEDPPFMYETQWGNVPGWWFLQTGLYQLALDEPLPAEIVFAPAHAEPATEWEHLFQPSYFISESFYADRAYWNRFTQEGPSQWAGQRFDLVAFPSAKGLMVQTSRPDLQTQTGGPSIACCSDDLPPTAVLWSDLSAQTLVVGSLIPGEPNFYHHGGSGFGSYLNDGSPIMNTKDGIFGRDR